MIEFITSAETTTLLKLLLILCVSALAGILAGNSAVYVFNHIPAAWLCDYDETPSDELLRKDTQRLKSHPWKWAFSMLFVVAAIKMAVIDWQYAIAAMAALWLLLEIAIADKKYMIIPDQFVILLAITAFGFVPYQETILSPLWGALLGGGCMLLVGVTGRLIFKKESLGLGDVKLFAAVGLATGPFGTAVCLIGSSFMSCIAFGTALLRKKVKRTDVMPLGPYIALAAALYLVFGQPV